MSRLPEIKARLKACENTGYGSPAMVEDMKLLLAVVEAEIGHYSPTYRAEHWRIKAKMAATPEAEKMCNDNAKAWEAIT